MLGVGDRRAIGLELWSFKGEEGNLHGDGKANVW